MDYINQAVELFYSERFCLFRNAAAVLGTVIVLRAVLRLMWGLGGGFCAFVLAPMGISRIDLKKHGAWAVVTGASEGIGRGYSLELARRGLNVVLMSRSEEKLQKVADEIKEKYGRDVRVIPVDFGDGQDIYPQIGEELKDLDIGVLVNNVGMSYEHPDYFCNIPEERLRLIIELNCQALVQMTRLLLPKMMERKRGIVVNISSAADVVPFQFYSVYSASKIFVTYFSEALRKEYKSKGIIVQCVTPMYVASAMSGVRRTSLTVPNGVQFARHAVATIGIKDKTCGCMSHALQRYAMENLVPTWLLNYFISKSLLDMRSKVLKKKARQSKRE